MDGGAAHSALGWRTMDENATYTDEMKFINLARFSRRPRRYLIATRDSSVNPL